MMKMTIPLALTMLTLATLALVAAPAPVFADEDSIATQLVDTMNKLFGGPSGISGQSCQGHRGPRTFQGIPRGGRPEHGDDFRWKQHSGDGALFGLDPACRIFRTARTMPCRMGCRSNIICPTAVRPIWSSSHCTSFRLPRARISTPFCKRLARVRPMHRSRQSSINSSSRIQPRRRR